MDTESKVKLDETAAPPSKARKKRLRKKAKGAAREEKPAEQICNALVRVCSDGNAKMLQGEDNEDIEVVETAGFKKYMSGMAEEPPQCGTKERVNWKSFYKKYNDEDEFYYENSDSEECYDSDYFYSDSSDEYDDHHHHHHGHNHHHHCPPRDYEQMKFKQSSSKHYTMVDSMSENVDGYVGNKSLDYIMDFLGEKNDTDSTKKAKKQSKASKKQQKKGKGVAETEKKKQAAAKKIPPTAAKDTAAKPTDEEQKAKIPADVKKFEQQSAKPAALNTKISSDADESVPNQEAAAVVEESGDEPKSADAGDKSCFVQVEEAEVKVSDAGTSDLGGSLSQKTETAASSSVGSTPEPEADATRQPAAPRERTYHTRVFFNSKLHGGSRGYLR